MTDSKKGTSARREFMRITTSIAVHMICLPKDGRVPDGAWVEGEMLEIGGGGARIEAPVDLESGDVLCIRFTLPDTEHEVRVYGRVVNTSGSGRIRQLCVKFVKMSQGERRMILQYAFREQIRRARAVVEAYPAGGDTHDERETDN
jgi:c-di-GMP-binding flagellar brake protein YcgR